MTEQDNGWSEEESAAEPRLNTPTERALYRDCKRYKAERDRYRTALEQIAAARGPLIEADPASLGHGFEQIAKAALDA